MSDPIDDVPIGWFDAGPGPSESNSLPIPDPQVREDFAAVEKLLLANIPEITRLVNLGPLNDTKDAKTVHGLCWWALGHLLRIHASQTGGTAPV